MENYSIKEIIEERFDEMREHLKEIKIQTTKTNGRVDGLEKSRTQIWTTIALFVFVVGSLGSLLLYALDARIDKGIRSVLSEYEIDIKR